jgi:hypothetical protein
VLGRFADGTPALTVRAVGSGRAYVAGSHLDVAAGKDATTRSLLGAIAEAAGAKRLFTAAASDETSARVYARLRRSNGNGLLAITSTSDTPTDLVVNVAARKAVDLLNGEEIDAVSCVSISVAARGSRLLALEELDAEA